MNKATIVFALSSLSFAVYATPANAVFNDITASNKTAVSDLSVTSFVRTLTSPELSWQERFEAEQKLAVEDSELVLLALISELSKESPRTEWESYNGSGSAQGDSRMPEKWQIFYALHRLWSAHVTKLFGKNNATPPASIGKKLIKYLALAPSKGWILQTLGGSSHSHIFWLAEAEKPVVTLFRDPKIKEEFRANAMQCLLNRTKQKYYSEIKLAIFAYDETDENPLFLKAQRLQMLIEDNRSKRFKNPKPPTIDNELVCSTFSMLPKLENYGEGRGSQLARYVGDYIGQEFKPDENDPKYGGETFHNAVYHTDTTAKALAWWEKNRDSYSPNTTTKVSNQARAQ